MSRRRVSANNRCKSLVLTSCKWSSIQNHLEESPSTAAAARDAQRMEQRRALSKQIQASWPNTLVNLHAKRLRDKQERLQKQEEEQCAIDAEEARYQAEVRRKQIDEARQQLFQRGEQVRELNRALLQAEVMKEREEQIALKNRMKSWQKEQKMKQQEKYLHMPSAPQDTGLVPAHIRRKQEVREQVQKQIARMVVDKTEEKLKDKRILQQNKRVHKWYEEPKEDVDKLRQNQKKKQQKSYQEQMRQKECRLLAEQQQEREQDEAIRLYKEAKCAMLIEVDAQQRRNRTRPCAELVARRTQEMAEEYERHQLSWYQQGPSAGSRIADRHAEQQLTDRRRHEEHVRRFHQQQEQRLAEKRQLVTDEQQQENREQQLMLQQLEEERVEQCRRREQLQKAMRDHWCDQIAEKETRRDTERTRDACRRHRLQQRDLEEQQAFVNYAKSVIDQAKNTGRSTFPLKKVIAKVAPHFNCENTEHEETTAKLEEEPDVTE